MKKLNYLKYLLSFAAVFSFASCDKGFEKLNQNEYSATSLDPSFLFTSVERNPSTGSYDGEQTIIQQRLTAFNLGATTAFNFNTYVDSYNTPRWNAGYGQVKTLVQIMSLTKDDPTKNNLYQMARILKAYNFMILVDSYGDVPYSEAGLGYLKNIQYPKYDKSTDIYADLYNELKAAVAALNPSGDAVPADFYYGTGKNTAASAQIPKWKRLGNSLLLRLGMRYSKLDPAKAQSIVTEAYNGGVMSSSSDDLFIGYNNVDAQGLINGLRTNNPYYYYFAEPFIDQLRNTKDPRTKYYSGIYANPNTITVPAADTTTANQYGFPVGYDQLSVKSLPSYKGANGNGFKYSQFNFNVFGSAQAPLYFVTYAQTELLLAEAAFRNWLPAGASTATVYYNAGIRANMDQLDRYPNAIIAPATKAVPDANYQSYIRQPSVALSAGTELQKINTQYWIASLDNGAEGWANWRRSGFPVLQPNAANTNFSAFGGFVRRFAYPQSENSSNTANYKEAVSRLLPNGVDDLAERVFWDK